MLRPVTGGCRAVAGNVAAVGSADAAEPGWRALVTGADSGIGQRVLSALTASGVDVAVSASAGDIGVPEGWVGQPFTVVDLTVGDHDSLAARRSSVTDAGRALLDLLERTGAEHLVLVSSALVYGAHPGNPVPITEEATLRPEPSFVYARQLAGVEERVERWRRAAEGRRVAVLRPVVTVATASTTSTLMTALTAGFGQRLGRDDPPAQFLHPDDLATAIATVVRERSDDVLNVAPDGWIPGHRIRALTGNRWRLPLPGSAAEVVSAWRWRLQRGPIPPGLLSYTQAPWVIANDRLRALGWRASVTNEQAYVEGTEEPWWGSVSPKRRQEFALVGAVAGVVATAALGALIGRWMWRRSRRR
ncbi:MAG: hypothetical protein RIR49_1000 [Actinomycetota bacterium]|jgi:nucleoside-diphosphate-sugar epimerase